MPAKKVTKSKQTLPEKVAEFIENNQDHKLKEFLNDQYPQDIAPVLENLKEEKKIFCFSLLELENASKVLAELSSETQKMLLKTLGTEKFGGIISQIDVDDATDIIIQLP